jgi:hypothetical protein
MSSPAGVPVANCGVVTDFFIVDVVNPAFVDCVVVPYPVFVDGVVVADSVFADCGVVTIPVLVDCVVVRDSFIIVFVVFKEEVCNNSTISYRNTSR